MKEETFSRSDLEIERDAAIIRLCRNENRSYFEVRSCGKTVEICSTLAAAKMELAYTHPLRYIVERKTNGTSCVVVPPKFSVDRKSKPILARTRVKVA